MAPFRNAEPKQTLSSSSEEEEEEEEEEAEEDASSSEGEEAELEKHKISTSVPKNSSAQNQPNTSKTRTSHPQPSSSSNSEPDSPSRPDPKSKPITNQTEEDASSSEGEEAELEKHKISTSVPKSSSTQNQPNTSKTRTSHPQPSSSSNSEPDSPSRPDPKSKPITKAAPKREVSGVVEEMAKKKKLFGEEDEITILKGMIGFKSARGVEPGSDVNGFLEFVKESLRFSGATKTQLYEKMRRLRQKYENNVMRGKKDGKDHPVFSRAHEENAFHLSKQIWKNVGGNGVGSGKAKVNASVRKSGSRTSSVGLRKGGEKREVERMEVDAEVEVSAGGIWSGRFCGSVGGLSSGEKIVKDGLGLISDSNKVELERKWKKLRVEETELYLKKLGLFRMQTEAVLEVMKSQGD